MQIAVPSETFPHERRVALIPETVKKLIQLGFEVTVEAGLGLDSGFSNAQYEAAGASISEDRKGLISGGDIVLRVRKPEMSEISLLKKNCLHISYLDPYN